jgi:hypothetical protein
VVVQKSRGLASAGTVNSCVDGRSVLIRMRMFCDPECVEASSIMLDVCL